jgi:hypothetical protein
MAMESNAKIAVLNDSKLTDLTFPIILNSIKEK